ncbi:MAG: YidC/Oxa1 family membrane protein insertase [Clostridia bacterium]|jgi:YidC/Oxa1 family membrane protein insertase
MNLDFIAIPLGHFLNFIYTSLKFLDPSDTQSVAFAYGLSIILFTLIIKTVLLPLTLKQYKSTAKMQKVQPQIKELQTRHKGDKEKLNTEMMKVYKENNVNPAGGCLPLLIQFPIIITLYWVIIQPLKFMLGKTPEQVTNLIAAANKIITENHLGISLFNKTSNEIDILNFFNSNIKLIGSNWDALVGNVNLKVGELINMNFLGLHLGEKAQYSPSLLFGPKAGIYIPLLLLVIIGVAATFISAKLMMPPKADPAAVAKKEAGPASSMQNSMLYIGPIMTLFFAFAFPAGVVLYWTVGYIFQVFQQLYVNKNIHHRSEAK